MITELHKTFHACSFIVSILSPLIVGNGFLQLKCYSSIFRLNRKQMGKKVLNHQQNSCFKHKLHIPIDKKRCGFTIRTETYPCGLGEDGKGDVRYISIKAIVIPFNIDHLLHFYKCTLKLIVQVSLIHPSSSSQEINQVSREMILERGQKEFVLIVSKVYYLTIRSFMERTSTLISKLGQSSAVKTSWNL